MVRGGVDGAASKVCPHCLQKRAPGLTAAPQAGQVVAEGDDGVKGGVCNA